MLKLFGQKQQARRQQHIEAERRLTSRRLLNISYGVLVLSLSLWCWQWLQKPTTLPIKTVKIYGDFSHISQPALQKLLLPYSQTGFFNVNIEGIDQQLLTLPWVKTVAVSRVWPHGLSIHITEKQPVARWGQHGLMNNNGRVFYPKQSTISKQLPLLIAPKGTQQQAFKQYQALSQQLASQGLRIKTLRLTARQAISLTLANGIELILGKQDTMGRLRRFIAVYPSVFTGKPLQGTYADMRYTNGMAVQWGAKR